MLVKSKLKYIQSLGQKKFRKEEGLFIAEGPKLVKELLEEEGVNVKEIYALKDWIDENKELLISRDVTEISAFELEKISLLATPNKVLALVKQFDNTSSITTKGKITLVLDDIQDPGNLGTIIRIGDWFGVNQLVCSHGCADVYNAKVIQSTMGSIARVRVIYTDISEWLKSQNNITVYASSLEGKNIADMQKIKEGIIIIGNESKGISPELFALANEKITISKKGKAESLNAAVACGIILSHLS
ncbi:tRNA methyltransferase [Chitinophagaceae bacterium IBVUCB2]|nr:tRNA methyltransferase [Chitinophagaceae bacterium IBVUCB2]